MTDAGTPSLAIRLDSGLGLVGAREAARRVGDILIRPCFRELSRLSARRKDRWTKHVKPTPDLIADYLADASNDAISMDTKRGSDLIASAEIENGVGRDEAPVLATRLQTYVAIPYVPNELDAVIAGIRDLAAALQAAAGFIALAIATAVAPGADVEVSPRGEHPGRNTQGCPRRDGRSRRRGGFRARRRRSARPPVMPARRRRRHRRR